MSIAWWDNVCREQDIRSTVSLVGLGHFTAATEAAQAIFLEWQSTDFSVLNISPTHPAPALETTTSAATTSEGLKSAPTTRNSSHSSHSSLSTGEKAGIGVGVAVSVLIVVVAALYVGYKFGRRPKKEATDPDATEGEAKIQSDAAKGKESLHHELSSSEGALYEAHGRSRPAELDTRNTRAELEGD